MNAIRWMAVAALLVTAACAPDEDGPDWPPVETLYRIDGLDVTCDGAETSEPIAMCDAEGTRVFRLSCYWREVSVGGAPVCYAYLAFERPDDTTPWTLAGICTSGDTCNPDGVRGLMTCYDPDRHLGACG